MKARFLHFADCHLGNRQYNNIERGHDFGRAFIWVIDKAVAEKVDFVVLAGDLFEKRSIDAQTLQQAMRGLERLQRANIPCLAVEGNHELAYFEDRVGWMPFLAARDLLILLDAKFENGAPQLRPYEKRVGSYFDPVPGLRVHGMRYYGSSTANALDAYVKAIHELPPAGIDYTLVIAHTGVEGVLSDQAGGLTHRQLAALRPHLDYLALGHIHKPFHFDNWVFNPGSLESCTIGETSWPERGYYLVQVDTEPTEEADRPKHHATLHANPRRTFHRLHVKTDLFTSPAELVAHCRELIQRKARDVGAPFANKAHQPVVELQLTGILPFERSALDLAALEALLQKYFEPLVSLIKNLTHPAEYAVANAALGMSRSELERQVLRDLLRRDARFQADEERWLALTLELKELALGDANPATIAARLLDQTSTLAQNL